MAEPNPTLIYLDTNVYARPFDDQMQPAIQAEECFSGDSGGGEKGEIE